MLKLPLELNVLLVNLQPGEELNHIWGKVQRERMNDIPLVGMQATEERRPESFKTLSRIPFWIPGYYLVNEDTNKKEWHEPNAPNLVKIMYERWMDA